MTKSPVFSDSERRQILNPRINSDRDHTSKWDVKIHEPTGMLYPELRYAVGQAVYYNISNRTILEIAGQYHVSSGFVEKYAKVFKAYKEANKKKKGSVSMVVFNSISNRPPKNKIKPIIPWDVRKYIIETRIARPYAGSKKIRVWVYEMFGIKVSCTGIDNILRSEGLIKRGRTRNNGYHGTFEREHSMTMVQIDYKSWPSGVKTLWVLDDSSRAILGYMVSSVQSTDEVIELLESVFDFWGCYPEQILSDHGSEFYSVSGGKGASKLDKWCVEHGISHIMGRVRHPQTQGKIERSHGTATLEIEYFGSMDTVKDAIETLAAWVDYYNNRRPHQAIDDSYPMNEFIARLPEERFERFLEGLEPAVIPMAEAC